MKDTTKLDSDAALNLASPTGKVNTTLPPPPQVTPGGKPSTPKLGLGRFAEASATLLEPVKTKVLSSITARVRDSGSTVKLQFAAGLYILSAATGVGKTVMTTALIRALMRNDVPCGYLPVFESRSPYVVDWASNSSTSEDQKKGANWFRRPGSFLTDVEELLAGCDKKKHNGVVAFDSITLPLSAFSPTPESKIHLSDAAQEGGFTASIAMFCALLHGTAVNHGVTIIGVMNSENAPWVSRIEGLIEGAISVNSPHEAVVRDRTLRKQISIQLPTVHEALDILGYKEGTSSITSVGVRESLT